MYLSVSSLRGEVCLQEMLRCRVEFGQICLLLLLLRSEDGTHVLRQHLAKFDSPLVKTVDSVDESFHGNSMFVEC